MTIALEVLAICKTYGDRQILDHVNVQVSPGEIVGLLGPNGAGKTTLFKIILGMESPDAGTIRLGRDLKGMPMYRRARLGLGCLPQTPSIFTGLSVRNNLLGILQTLRTPKPADVANRLLDQFELLALSDQKASTLSGGERRRLEFARALCSNPGMLLVDEPFAGVDPISARDIATRIQHLAASGIGVLLTDHQVRYALDVCSRISLLSNGVIVESGTSAQFRTSETARRLYLGNDF